MASLTLASARAEPAPSRARRTRALAAGGAVFVVLLLAAALAAPLIAPADPIRQSLRGRLSAPTLSGADGKAHLLGTDHLGRDVLSRIIYGARVSMTVGVVAECIVLAIGVPLGALAGYYGGRLDMILMRFVDVMYAFPRLLFVIMIMSMLGRGLLNIFIAIGLTGWVRVARLTRAQMLSLKEREFCEAARAAGAGNLAIIVRHLLPNALTPIIISLTFGIPEAILRKRR